MATFPFPLTIPALRIDQPLGVFFAVVLKARALLDVAYSDFVKAELEPDTGSYTIDGAQRLSDPRRLDAIARYINRIDASFPNSIILAANMIPNELRIEGDINIDDDSTENVDEDAEIAKRWKVNAIEVKDKAGNVTSESYTLTIPTSEKLATVIDGQHRLFAFAKAEPKHLEDDLLCAVFLDLPKSMQATIFATINSNQKAVDKSLTYDLFGYNLDDEPEDEWSPEKLAVFVSRRIAIAADSVMRGRVTVAPINDFASASLLREKDMKISFAVIVTGVLKLISSNPKEDANKLKRKKGLKRKSLPPGKPPLRSVYIDGNDTFIYGVVRNFLNACQAVFWERAPVGSFIRKTVGMQALFDILRELTDTMLEAGDMTEEAFERRLAVAGSIPFEDDYFTEASGSNRSRIRRIIRARMGLVAKDTLPADDQAWV